MSVLRDASFVSDYPADSIWRSHSFYFWVFVFAAIIVILTTIIRSFLYAFIIRKMVDWLVMDLVTKILKTKQSFFDVTPNGEIMVRL